MANINLNLVATAQTGQAEAAIARLKASVANLQKAYEANNLSTFNQAVQNQVNYFNDAIKQTEKFRIHTVEASTEADRLAQRLVRHKGTWSDFTHALGRVNKEGNRFLEIGMAQQRLMEAQAIKVGKTAYVYEDLALQFDNAQRKSLALARGIAAQNAMLKAQAIQVINVGKNMQWTGRQLTMGITMPLALFGASTARIFNEVDKNLTRLAKVYGVGLAQPTEAAIKGIRKEVLALSNDLAKSLGMTAIEVSDIAAQFAAAGLQGKELIAATKQASRMVVLGEADKQDAINATISLQTAYRLNTAELTEAVNFFNAAQAATSTNMADLINAIPRVGPVIKNLGGSYKDMVAILTALKEGGVPASEAANAIKNSLSRIITPTGAAQERLKSFGIDLKDIVAKNAGNLSGTLKELQDGLLNLDNISRQQAITELFGRYQSARMTAFIQNFNQTGTQSAKVIEMMGMSAVELANIADTQTKRIQESASGRFKIAVETMKSAMLPFGEMFLNTFGAIIEKITELVNALHDLPAPVKSILKIFAGISAGIGPIVMAGGLLGNMIGSIGQGLVKLKQIGGAFRSLFSAAGFEGFKIISTGFKDIDIVATTATKAIDIFNNKVEKDTTDSSKIFVAHIDAMIKALDQLAVAANNTRVAVTPPIVPGGGGGGGTTPPGTPGPIVPGGPFPFTPLPGETSIPKNKYRYLMSTGVLRNTTDMSVGAGLLDALNKALGPRTVHYREEGELPSQAIARTFASAGRSSSLSDDLFRAIEANEQAMAKMVPTRTEHLTSVGEYFARLQIAEKTDTTLWKQEITKLNQIIETQGVSAERKLQAMRDFEAAVGMQGAQFVDTMTTEIMSLEKLTANMSEQETRAFLLNREAGLLGRLSVSGREGFTAPGAGTGDKNRGAQSLLYAASGGGTSQNPEELLGTIQRAKSKYQNIEHLHLMPVEQIIRNSSLQTRRIIEYWAKLTQQDIESVAQQMTQGMVPTNKSTPAAGLIEFVNSRKQKLMLDISGGLENLIVYKFDEAGNLVRASVQQISAMKRNPKLIAELERLGLAIGELQSKTAAAVADAANQVNAAPVSPRRNIGQRLGTVGMMASMGMMTMGYGNDLANKAMLGVSSASMLTMLPSFMAAGAGPQAAIFAAVAAIPLLITGMQKVVDAASKMNRSMEGAFKTSKSEADMLNITLHEFSSYEAPAVGEEAKKAKTQIDSFAESFKGLGEGDPLKTLIDSLKDMSTEDQMKMLQAKYLTLRIQGVNDEEARNFVKAILRAGGIEAQQGGTASFEIWAGKNSSLSTPDMIVANAKNSLELAEKNRSILDRWNTVQGTLGYTAESGLSTANPSAPIGPQADAVRKSVDSLATNLNELMAVAGETRDFETLSDQLDEIKGGMSKTQTGTLLLSSAIRELYEKAGMVGTWDLIKNTVEAEDKIKLLQLRANGAAKDLEYLTSHPWEIRVRYNRLTSITEMTGLSDQLMSGLTEKAGRTSYTTQVATEAAKATTAQADAQKNVVDKLQEELDLRNKIIESQQRSLEFSNSQASLQQQYNAALSENDLAKAADLQRQMALSRSKYNDELEKSALQSQLDKENKNLAATQKSIDAVSAKAETVTTNLSEYQTTLWNLVYDTAKNGQESTSKELNKVAKELHDKFQIPIKDIKEAVINAAKQFKSDPIAKFALESGRAIETDFLPKQRESAVTQAYLNILAQHPRMKATEAYAQALESVIGNGVNVEAKRDPNTGAVTYGVVTNQGTSFAQYQTLTPGGEVASTTVNAANAGTKSWTKIPAPPANRRNQFPFYDTMAVPPRWIYSSDPGLGFQERYISREEWNAGKKKFNTGGPVSGPGTGTSDSIPAMLSNGEYVIKASSVRKYGKETFDGFNTQKFAEGGLVTNRKEWENPTTTRWVEIPKPPKLAVKKANQGINPFDNNPHQVAGSQLFYDKGTGQWRYGVPYDADITYSEWKSGPGGYMDHIDPYQDKIMQAIAMQAMGDRRIQKPRLQDFTPSWNPKKFGKASSKTNAELELEAWKKSVKYTDRLNLNDAAVRGPKTWQDTFGIIADELVTDVKAAALVPVVGSMLIGGGRAGASWFGLEKGENYLNENFGVSKDANPLLKMLAATGRFGYNIAQGALSGASATGLSGLIGGAVFGGLEGLVGIGQSGLDYGTKGGNQAATSKTDFSPEALLNELIMNQGLATVAGAGFKGISKFLPAIKNKIMPRLQRPSSNKTAPKPRPAQNSYAMVQMLVKHMRNQPGFDAKTFYKLGSEPTPANAAGVEALKKAVYNKLVQAGKFSGTYDDFINQLEPTLMHTVPGASSWSRPTSLVQDVNRMIAEMAGVDPDAMVRLYRSVNVTDTEAGYSTLDAFYSRIFGNNGISQSQVRYDLPISDLPNPLFFGAAPAEFAQTVSSEVLEAAANRVKIKSSVQTRVPGTAGNNPWRQASRFGAFFTRNPIKRFSTPTGVFKDLQESGAYPKALFDFIKRQVLVSQKNSAGGYDHTIAWMRMVDSPEFIALLKDYPQLESMRGTTMADLVEAFPDLKSVLEQASGKSVFQEASTAAKPSIPAPPKTRFIDKLILWAKSKKGLYHGGVSGLKPEDFRTQDLRGWNWPATYFSPEKYIASSYAMAGRSANPAVYKLLLGFKQAMNSNVLNMGRRITEDQKQALIQKLYDIYGNYLSPDVLTKISKYISSSKNIDQALHIFKNVKVDENSTQLRLQANSFADELFGISSSDAVINFNKITTKLKNYFLYNQGLLGEKAIGDDISQTFFPNIGNFNLSQITSSSGANEFYANLPGLDSPIIKFLTRNLSEEGLEVYGSIHAVTRLHNWLQILRHKNLMPNEDKEIMSHGLANVLSSLGIKLDENDLRFIERRLGITDQRPLRKVTSIATGGYINKGMVEIPKYHTGGFVNYAYGKEIAAMLEGGEVVIPKEVVRDIQSNNHSATNSSSMYNNNITVNVAGTNASPQEIANAVSEAMQRRQSMTGSRTVVR